MTVADLTFVIHQLLPEPHAGLLAGMLFGVKSALSTALYEELVRTGTLHIVALSGMNITILISLTNILLLRFVGRRISSVLTIGCILWFVWFVGPSASVIRAAIMGSITLIAVIFGRQTWAIWSWIIAVGGMLLLNPSWTGDLSFQLSVMATLGIILFGEKQEEKKKLLSFIKEDFRITLSAQVFTIPIILFAFHRVSLVAPISNVLIGWVIGPLTGAGLLMTVSGAVWLPLGQIIAWAVWVPLQYILVVVTGLSQIPFASIGW